MDYGQIFHVMCIGKYYCKNMKYRISILEKWFPLQGERAQSLKVYNIRMSVFKNNIIEIRKRR